MIKIQADVRIVLNDDKGATAVEVLVPGYIITHQTVTADDWKEMRETDDARFFLEDLLWERAFVVVDGSPVVLESESGAVSFVEGGDK